MTILNFGQRAAAQAALRAKTDTDYAAQLEGLARRMFDHLTVREIEEMALTGTACAMAGLEGQAARIAGLRNTA